jgi:hypothetical protein
VTDPDTVARALARLADGSCSRLGSGAGNEPPERVVADAESAVEQLDAAAAFVDDGGERRLRRAVEAAEESGDDDLAARGQGVLTTLAQFRAAANGKPPGRSVEAAGTTSTPLAQRSSPEGS